MAMASDCRVFILCQNRNGMTGVMRYDRPMQDAYVHSQCPSHMDVTTNATVDFLFVPTHHMVSLQTLLPPTVSIHMHPCTNLQWFNINTLYQGLRCEAPLGVGRQAPLVMVFNSTSVNYVLRSTFAYAPPSIYNTSESSVPCSGLTT